MPEGLSAKTRVPDYLWLGVYSLSMLPRWPKCLWTFTTDFQNSRMGME